MKLSVHLPARDSWNKVEEKKYSIIQTKSNDVEAYEKKWDVINTLDEDQFYLLLSDEVTADDYDGMDYWLDRYNLAELEYVVEIYSSGKKYKIDKLTCSCVRPKMYMCAPCGVSRDAINEEWQPLYEKNSLFGEDQEYEEWKKENASTGLAKSLIMATTSTHSCSENWWDDWTGGCRHYGAVVNIEGVEFHASSIKSKRTGDDYVPDFGLYLDDVWTPYWRNEFILWTDHGVPVHLVIAFEQILSAVEMAIDGVEVEVGCIGGHGRTGTALACAAVILGMEPEEAIKHIREAYCKEAIESASQEWYIHWCHAQLNHLPSPPQPKTNWGSYTPKDDGPKTGTISSGAICQRSEHYNSWKNEGRKFCKRLGGACRWWGNDVTSFESGWLPGGVDNFSYADVRGYRIPRPNSGDKHHDPMRKRGCICDLCRYLNRGFSAFLEPGYEQKGKRETWLQNMAWLDSLEAVVEEKTDKLKVLHLNGKVLEINISPKFTDKAPTKKGLPDDVSGNFVWMMDPETLQWDWVWNKLSRSKQMRDKKRQLAKETVDA